MRTRIGAAAGLTAGATLAMGGVAHAACTCTVNSLADPTEGGHTTLRDAIASANANPGSTITFASGLSGSIDLASDLTAITHAVDIEGPGAGALTIKGHGHRIFFVYSQASADTIRIAGLTLTGGYAPNGGAIDDYVGALTVANDVISGNTAPNGGGIYSDERLTVTGSTVSGNHSGGEGGGINQRTAGSLTVQNSTVSGNTARVVPGIFVDDLAPGPVAISDSTISGNTGSAYGGGLALYRVGGASTIDNTTISGNHSLSNGLGAYTGLAGGVNVDLYTGTSLVISGTTIAGNDAGVAAGGLHVYMSNVNNIRPVLDDTIVAGNSAPTAPDLLGDVNAAFSLVQNTSGGLVVPVVPGSDLTGTDPQLGPLAGNGGATQTMKPALGSPAVDSGRAFGLTVDQRGAARPFDVPTVGNASAAGADGSDMGAVELQASDIATPVTPAPVTPVGTKRKCKKKKHRKHAAAVAKKKCKKHKKRK
jgi:predicted outer membrane repeat protein